MKLDMVGESFSLHTMVVYILEDTKFEVTRSMCTL